jgi:hypothetical protein
VNFALRGRLDQTHPNATGSRDSSGQRVAVASCDDVSAKATS